MAALTTCHVMGENHINIITPSRAHRWAQLRPCTRDQQYSTATPQTFKLKSNPDVESDHQEDQPERRQA